MDQVPFLAGGMINSVAGETMDVKDRGNSKATFRLGSHAGTVTENSTYCLLM